MADPLLFKGPGSDGSRTSRTRPRPRTRPGPGPLGFMDPTRPGIDPGSTRGKIQPSGYFICKELFLCFKMIYLP